MQTLAPSQNPIPTFAQGENLLEKSAPSQNPMQTLAPSENTIPTFAQGENLFETSAPSQNPIQTLAQGQNQFPVQPGNQGVDVVAASMGSKGLDRLSVAPSAANSQAGRLSQVPPILDKPGSAGGAKPSAFDTLSVTHGAGKFDSVHHGSHLVEGQPAGPGVDVSAMMRELAGARGAMKTAGDTAGGSTAETTGSGPREAFAALDAEGAPGKPAWISAGAQRAEAGFQDPALGWVGVRADLGGGGIHAALVPGSADAAQALGGHLAGLNAYLAEHHTPVGTVTMAAPEGGWAGVGADKGAGQGMQQGAGQQTGQETAGGSDAGSQSGPSPGPTVLPTASSGLPAWSGGLDGTAQAARPGGVHISVMA